MDSSTTLLHQELVSAQQRLLRIREQLLLLAAEESKLSQRIKELRKLTS